MEKRKITMQFLADELGISKVTVSKALNDKDGVGEELKRRILELADNYGYIAPNLNRGEEGYHIAICCDNKFLKNSDEHNFYPSIFQKISRELIKKNHIGTLLSVRKSNHYGEFERLLGVHKFDGVIVLGKLDREFFELIEKIGLPKVYVDTDEDSEMIPTIKIENIYSVCNLTEYLISEGHKEIGFVGSTSVTKSILDRYLGYQRAMLLHGLKCKEEWMIKDRDERNEEIALELPEKLPTAFVCNCDDTAYRIVKELTKRGLKVPDDISVVGFDNDIFSKISVPPITTIAPDISYMGKKATELIIKQIYEPKRSISGPILINGKIIYRDSVMKIE